MKMTEFLSLSDDDKERLLNQFEGDDSEDKYAAVTEDKGICGKCGGEADAGDFCFGCHKLVCQKCFEEEPHLAECVAKDLLIEGYNT